MLTFSADAMARVGQCGRPRIVFRIVWHFGFGSDSTPPRRGEVWGVQTKLCIGGGS
jgi:hypothetical protein